MSKLKLKLNTNTNTVRKAKSYEGNLQAVKSSEQQLYEIAVMTLYGKDNFYQTNEDIVTRSNALILDIVQSGNGDFIANLIQYARTEMHIRSMPIIMTIQFAVALRKANRSYSALRQVVCDVIQRADQITDLYAVALDAFGSKKEIPMAIKRGVADAFLKFNEYNFQKYNRSGAVKLRDVLRIVHPVARNNAQGEMFERIMKDTLATPYTWETELSVNGSKPTAERKTNKQLWSELVNSGKLGYMALLRNLRNITQAEVDSDVYDKVAATLSDPEQVKKSRQLPFRYISALTALNYSNTGTLKITRALTALNDSNTGTLKITRAINKALDASFMNVPSIGKNVWIIIDCSGSMGIGGYNYSSGKTQATITPIKHAVVFAAALVKAHSEGDNVKVTMFSDNAHNIAINPDDTLTTIAGMLNSKVYGGGTNLQAALNMKGSIGFEPDTVVVLSDMQVTQLSRTDVSSMFDKDCIKVAINLASYETTPLGQLSGWLQLAGFSDRIFDMIPALREKNSIKKRFSHAYETQGILIPYDLLKSNTETLGVTVD